MTGASSVPLAALDPADRPLIVTAYNADGEEWCKQIARLDRWRSGYAYALAQEPGASVSADVIGTLHCPGGAPTARGSLARAFQLAGAAPPLGDDAATLARSALARWRTRQLAFAGA
jgi:hypothetical protein